MSVGDVLIGLVLLVVYIALLTLAADQFRYWREEDDFDRWQEELGWEDVPGLPPKEPPNRKETA